MDPLRADQSVHKNINMVLPALLVVLAIQIVRTAWLCDDAYITFRTIDHFLEGYGLRWNIVERVQSFTHPLWMLLVSFFSWFTGNIPFTAIGLGLVCTMAAVILLTRYATNMASAIIVVITLLSSKAFIDYSTSGLENPLSYLLGVLFVGLLLHPDPDEKSDLMVVLTGSLLMTNRQDMLILVGLPMSVIGVRLILLGRLKALVFAASPIVLWELFALIYYGFPFPNTYYGKLHTGIPSIQLWLQGSLYFLDGLSRDPITLFAILCSMIVALKSTFRGRLLGCGILLYLIYVSSVGGDFMSGRFFAVPLIIGLTLFAMRVKIQRTSDFGIILVPIFLLGWSTNLGSLQGPAMPDALEQVRKISPSGIADERAYYIDQTGLLFAKRGQIYPNHYSVEQALNEEKTVVSRKTIGIYGYFVEDSTHIVDKYGLADPLLSRLYTKPKWRIGHYWRNIPAGYMESQPSGDNQIADPGLRDYYDTIRLITRGPLFSADRWKAIWKLNTGQLDHLINQPKQIQLSELSTSEPSEKQRWNRAPAIKFGYEGLQIQPRPETTARQITLTLGGNDSYTVDIDCGETLVQSEISGPGVDRFHTVTVDLLEPDNSTQCLLHRVTIHPQTGDGRYSIGHMVLDSSSKPE